ncbi:MAG: hypothetical protein AAF399_17580, partial [Bacteroidota bacterium]
MKTRFHSIMLRLFLLIAVGMILSCKGRIPEKPTYQISYDFMKYIAPFSSNGVYIYRDSSTGFFDTVSVSKELIFGPAREFISEGFFITFESNYSRNFWSELVPYDTIQVHFCQYPVSGGHEILYDGT